MAYKKSGITDLRMVFLEVHEEPVEGQSRTIDLRSKGFFVSEAFRDVIAAVRPDAALHYDKLSANGSIY